MAEQKGKVLLLGTEGCGDSDLGFQILIDLLEAVADVRREVYKSWQDGHV
ncbi:hypothetical protein ES708_24574 [subsurface metagenome]